MSSPALRYLQRVDDPKLVREIITPEGVPIQFTLAGIGDRAGAFILDFLFLSLALTVIGYGLQLAVLTGSWLAAVMMVLSFVVTNFYFVFFEMRWQGRTPGKKINRITVIDSRGGQLQPGAILARNFSRYLELWFPLGVLFGGDMPVWATLMAAAWLLVVMFLPMFNRDKLRVGDIIAGTRVVRQPKAVLLPDLAAEPAAVVSTGWGPPAAAAAFTFTAAQLDIYGIYELQVLEGVLRVDAGTLGHGQAMTTVAEKIVAKIQYGERLRPADEERFLRDFYTALRAHLEKKMLFGKRREDKFSK